jgi:hypothetical protein
MKLLAVIVAIAATAALAVSPSDLRPLPLPRQANIFGELGVDAQLQALVFGLPTLVSYLSPEPTTMLDSSVRSWRCSSCGLAMRLGVLLIVLPNRANLA